VKGDGDNLRLSKQFMTGACCLLLLLLHGGGGIPDDSTFSLARQDFDFQVQQQHYRRVALPPSPYLLP